MERNELPMALVVVYRALVASERKTIRFFHLTSLLLSFSFFSFSSRACEVHEMYGFFSLYGYSSPTRTLHPPAGPQLCKPRLHPLPHLQQSRTHQQSDDRCFSFHGFSLVTRATLDFGLWIHHRRRNSPCFLRE